MRIRELYPYWELNKRSRGNEAEPTLSPPEAETSDAAAAVEQSVDENESFHLTVACVRADENNTV